MTVKLAVTTVLEDGSTEEFIIVTDRLTAWAIPPDPPSTGIPAAESADRYADADEQAARAANAAVATTIAYKSPYGDGIKVHVKDSFASIKALLGL